MAIKFRCLHCQKGLSIGSRMAGTNIQCIQCHADLTVPAASDEALANFHVKSGPTDSDDGVRSLDFDSGGGAPRWVAAGFLLLLAVSGAAVYFLITDLNQEQATAENDPEGIARNSGGDPRLLPFVDNDKGLIVPFPPDGVKPPAPQPKPVDKPPPPPAPLPAFMQTPELLAPTPQETEEELYRKALQMALAALEGENYQRAKDWFKIAGGLRMTDEVLKGLQRAEGGLLEELERERRRQLLSTDTQKRGEFELWMRRGQTHLGWREFDQALSAFQRAGQIFPGDPNVSQFLARTKKAMADALVTEKQQRALAERELERRNMKKLQQDFDDYNNAMARGGKLMRDGKFQEALAPYYLAKELFLDNGEARKEWSRAQRMLEEKRLDDLRREEEKWRLAREEREKKQTKELIIAFDLAMNDANKWQRDGQLDRALIALLQALHLKPGDREAMRMRREVEKTRDEEVAFQQAARAKRMKEIARIEADSRKRAEEFERQANAWRLQELANQREMQFQQMIARGQFAMAQRRFDVALRFFGDARGMRPDDSLLLGLLKQAQQGQAQFDAGHAWMQKQKETIDREKDETVRRQLMRQRQEREAMEAKEQGLFLAQLQERLRKESEDALENQRYDIALARLEAAKALNPQDQLLMGLDRKAREEFKVWKEKQTLDREKDEKERAAAWTEAKRRQEELAREQAAQNARFAAERKARDLRDTIDAGLTAQRRGQYDLALGFFRKAKDLGGNDDDLKNLIDRASREKETYGEVVANLAKQQAEQEALLAAQRQRDAEEARQRELERTANDRFVKALTEGARALGQRHFEEAIGSFSQALEIDRAHKGARDGLRQAQEGLEQRLAAARQEQERRDREDREKQAATQVRQQDEGYRTAMTFGRDAFAKKRYDAAIGCFDQALSCKPGDEAATTEKNRALAARDALTVQGQQDLERIQKKQADDAALQKAFALAAEEANRKRLTQQQEMEELAQLKAIARAALELGQLDAARAALETAGKSAPKDLVLTQLRGLLAKADQKATQAKQDGSQIQDALAAIPFSPGERQSVEKAKVELHLKQGAVLLERRQFDEAGAEFRAALSIAAENPQALAGLERAKKRTP